MVFDSIVVSLTVTRSPYRVMQRHTQNCRLLQIPQQITAAADSRGEEEAGRSSRKPTLIAAFAIVDESLGCLRG